MTLSLQPLASPHGFVRWTDYLADENDGFIYSAGERQTVSDLSSLPSHLARVADTAGSRMEERIPTLLDFYRAFGFLAPAHRQLRARDQRRQSLRSSESIAWALHHAWNVRTIMALHRERRDELDRLLASFDSQRKATVWHWQGKGSENGKPPSTVTRRSISVPMPRPSDPVQDLMPTREKHEDALAFSRRIIHGLLSPNLTRARRSYDPQTGTPRFEFECLIDVVYWQLADSLVAGELRQCECGQLFFATDGRQRSCPPLPGRRESKCGRRFRMRRYRRPDS